MKKEDLQYSDLVFELIEVGFKPKTISTHWYEMTYTQQKERPFLNEPCEYLYFCEAFRWCLKNNQSEELIEKIKQIIKLEL